MLKDIISVRPLDNFQLYLHFEDGIHGVVNIKDMIELTGVFAPLQDPEYFSQVQVNSEFGSIEWPNQADLDPDVLYAAITGERIRDYATLPLSLD